MSLAENLLNSLGETRTASPEQEPHIIVGADRFIKVPEQLKKIAVTNDKDIETVHFDCVRYWDGYDLSTFAIYLNIALPNGAGTTYIPKNITTSENFYHFDWVIEGNITPKSGTIGIGITAIKTKTNENGEIVTDKRWNSFPNTECSIVKGFDIENVPSEEESSDVIAQLSAILEEIQSNLGLDGVPNYVKTEAESVIDRVIAAQKERTFTFAAISDLHYGNNGYTDGIKHACQAMKYIDKRIKLDAVAVLGDYTDNYPSTDYDDAISDFKSINNILTDLRFGQNLRIQGNHDYYADHKGEINRFISSYSDDVVWGSFTGGYFYKDFCGQKLRIICINTSENGGMMVSTSQYNWFINSLDLTSKEDSEEWQIIALSHHPLDWWADTYVFSYVLDAYKNGTSWTNGTITCDFAGKNKATFIGNIHGHIHNFKTDYLRFGNPTQNADNKTAILRMCTPNACYDRENGYNNVEYNGVWAEDTTYSKTKNSAKDTAFCIYCIDLDTNTINAICYGAGYDRTANYKEGTITEYFSVTYDLTNVESSVMISTVEKYMDSYFTTLTPTVGEIKYVKVTMGGVDVTSDSYDAPSGEINISTVEGDIVITAVAEEVVEPEEPEPPVSYTNWIPKSINADGTQYVGANGEDGYKVGYRINSSGAESSYSGVNCTGYIPVSNGDVVYFKNIAFISGGESNSAKIQFYDENFTSINGITPNNIASMEYLIRPYEIDGTTGYLSYITNADGAAYIRVSAIGLDSNSIITINEPIE